MNDSPRRMHLRGGPWEGTGKMLVTSMGDFIVLHDKDGAKHVYRVGHKDSGECFGYYMGLLLTHLPPDLPTFDGNTKDDAAKSPVVQGVLHYFPKALAAVGLVSQAGAKKYDWNGWKDVEDGRTRYTDALGRHLLSEAEEDVDVDITRYSDVDIWHDMQVAWNALARLELRLTGKG